MPEPEWEPVDIIDSIRRSQELSAEHRAAQREYEKKERQFQMDIQIAVLRGQVELLNEVSLRISQPYLKDGILIA